MSGGQARLASDVPGNCGLGVTPEQCFQSCIQRGKFLHVIDGVRSGHAPVEGGWLVTGLSEQSLSLSSFLSVVSIV